MKKYIILAIAIITTGISAAYADDDRAITKEQLPKAAQEFLSKYFPTQKIALAKEETDFLDKTYEVIFVDGAEYGAIGVGAVGLILGSYSVNLPRYLNPDNKSVCMGLATAGVVLSVFGFILGLMVYAGVF